MRKIGAKAPKGASLFPEILSYTPINSQFDANTNTRERQSPTNITGTFILTGKLFDETGDRLSPTSANRNGKRHRYYVSRRLLRTGDRSNGGWRLPARQLEQVVIDGAVALLNDPIRLSRELPSLSAGDTRRLLEGATALASGTASEGHGQTGAMAARPAPARHRQRRHHPHRALESGATGWNHRTRHD